MFQFKSLTNCGVLKIQRFKGIFFRWQNLITERIFFVDTLRIDDLATRPERRASDKLATIDEMHNSFTSNCEMAYELNAGMMNNILEKTK